MKRKTTDLGREHSKISPWLRAGYIASQQESGGLAFFTVKSVSLRTASRNQKGRQSAHKSGWKSQVLLRCRAEGILTPCWWENKLLEKNTLETSLGLSHKDENSISQEDVEFLTTETSGICNRSSQKTKVLMKSEQCVFQSLWAESEDKSRVMSYSDEHRGPGGGHWFRCFSSSVFDLAHVWQRYMFTGLTLIEH